jgi:hypothetical protein
MHQWPLFVGHSVATYSEESAELSGSPGTAAVRAGCPRQRTAVAIMEGDTSAAGLNVFDKTLQTGNIWLDQIMAKLGPDRRVPVCSKAMH